MEATKEVKQGAKLTHAELSALKDSPSGAIPQNKTALKLNQVIGGAIRHSKLAGRARPKACLHTDGLGKLVPPPQSTKTVLLSKPRG